jgi:hypothetical protein
MYDLQPTPKLNSPNLRQKKPKNIIMKLPKSMVGKRVILLKHFCKPDFHHKWRGMKRVVTYLPD